MKRIIQKIISISLVATILLGTTLIASATDTVISPKIPVEKAILETGKYLSDKVKEPTLGSMGGEWVILGLARGDYPVTEGYYDGYYNRIATELKAKNGELSKVKYTEYSRLILALTAIGKDVTNVAGYNLLEKLADYNQVLKQGINGPVFALIALDSHNYKIPTVKNVEIQSTRQMFIDYILSKEITNSEGVTGGFSLSGTVADPDITGMALQALSRYQDQKKVKDATERALDVISKGQMDDGGYGSWGTENSESTSQMIVALSALKIDAAKDIRFIKADNKGQKNWLVSNLTMYCVLAPSSEMGYGIEHLLGKGINQMATEQGYYALISYDRLVKGKNSLYDMSDVLIKSNSSKSSADGITVMVNGTLLSFDQPPLNINGRVMVPFGIIANSLGAKVEWDQSNQRVTGILENKKITLTINSTTAYINGEAKTLDVPAKIVNGRTLVPIRFVAQSLDAEVEWNPTSKTVLIKKEMK